MIRTRIAPSPTGPLHIGTARSALFNFIFARKHKGVFVLRIEDTDLERSDPVFEEDIKEGLNWLGIDWDELYKQSERLDIYESYLKTLLEKGLIFWCSHSEAELVSEKQEQISRKEAPRHICRFRDGSIKELASGKGILRFKNDSAGEVVFDDLIRGQIAFDGRVLGDFSVAKNLRAPLYNFAVVLDDREMAISHVIRGEDHISNTPKQILLQEALGFERPLYAHLPLILGTDRSKLSKRHGATSVLEYKKSGYLPEAVINFMILLGWRPSPAAGKGETEKEIFSMEEILREFALERVQKSGAVFSTDKLNWMNALYIKKAGLEELAQKTKFFCPALMEKIESDPQKWKKITALLRERLTVLSEACEMAEYFYNEPYYPRDMLFWKEEQSAQDIVRRLSYIMASLEEINPENWSKKVLEARIMPYADKEGRGEVLWPFRAALSGKRASPGPFEIAEAIGKPQTTERLQRAIKLLL